MVVLLLLLLLVSSLFTGDSCGVGGGDLVGGWLSGFPCSVLGAWARSGSLL